MAEDAGSVYSEVRIHLDQLDNDLKGVYARLDQMESRIKSQTSTASKTATKSFDAMSVAGVAAFLGVGNAIKSTITTYASFSQSMSNVAAVSNATGAQLQKLTDAAKTAGATTKYTASQAADALFNLAQAGMNADQATQALTGVLSLAQASGAGLAASAESMAASLSQFGLQASDSARVANVFAAAANTSLASMDKLTTGLRQVGPVAGTLGISLEEVTANLDALFNKGFQGEQAGTALRSILLDLVDPSSTVVQALEKQGMTYDKVNPKVVGLSGAFENMKKAGVDLTTVFGKVSAAEALALIDTAGKATGNLRDMQKEITGTDAAASAAAKMNDNLNGSLLTMQSQAESAAISIGDTFNPALRGAVTVIGELFAWLAKLPTPILAVVGGLGTAAVAVGGLAVAFRVLGIAATGALGPIGIAIGVVTTAAGIAGTAINKQKNVTADLNKVTNDLTTATNDYNTVQTEATTKADTLSEAEKKVLDNRKVLLQLEVEKQLNNLASSYDKTTKSIDDLNKKQEKEKQDLKDLQDWQQKFIDLFVSEGMSIDDACKKAAKYDNMGKNIIKVQSKLTETTGQVTKAQTDLQSAINSVASMVAKGTLNIDWLKTANVGLYNAIMAAVPAMKQQEEIITTTGESTTSSATKLAAWQKALQDALNVKNISSGKSAVTEYIATTKNELNKAVDAAKTTGGDVAKVYQDYAKKVNDAITQLIMSGEYVGNESTIQSLKEFAEELNNISDSFGASPEQLNKFKEISSEIENLGSLSGETFSSMKNYIIEEINNAGLLSDQVKELLANLNDTKAATIDWGVYAAQAFLGALSSFSALGEAIAEGKDVWAAFGSAALGAISQVLQGIGAELAIMAAKQYVAAAAYASNPATALLAPGAIAAGVKATAESAVAYTAAGLVSGWASNISSAATGGIVEPSSGGSLVNVAENGSGEVMFNNGSSGQKFIDQMGSAIASKLNASGGTQTVILQLDSKEVTRVVTRRQRNGDY